jgi:hypothetical protein
MHVGPSARRQGLLGLSGKASMCGDQPVGSGVGTSVVSCLLTRNNQGDFTILARLKEDRAKLSLACRNVLRRFGSLVVKASTEKSATFVRERSIACRSPWIR